MDVLKLVQTLFNIYIYIANLVPRRSRPQRFPSIEDLVPRTSRNLLSKGPARRVQSGGSSQRGPGAGGSSHGGPTSRVQHGFHNLELRPQTGTVQNGTTDYIHWNSSPEKDVVLKRLATQRISSLDDLVP